jgi:vacuolar-type H+-ATPase subunit F/Vma7
VLEAGTADEGVASLRDLLAQPDVGVVLVEESFHDRLPEDVRRRLARNPLPIVVPFPGPAWEERPEAAESYIVELLRRVIGYRVRLR